MIASRIRMHKVLTTIASILVYTCKGDSESTETTMKADTKQQANFYPPYLYYLPMFYYPYYPQPFQTIDEEEAQPQKPLGGDRSDRWLYPPRSYYIRWADEEEQNDWDQWDKWGQWRGWYRRPTPATEPSE